MFSPPYVSVNGLVNFDNIVICMMCSRNICLLSRKIGG